MIRFSVLSKSTLSSRSGTQRSEARCLDGAEAVCLTRPPEAVALSAGIDDLAQRAAQVVEVDLAALGARLGEEPQELFAPLLRHVVRGKVELLGFLDRVAHCVVHRVVPHSKRQRTVKRSDWSSCCSIRRPISSRRSSFSRSICRLATS